MVLSVDHKPNTAQPSKSRIPVKFKLKHYTGGLHSNCEVWNRLDYKNIKGIECKTKS